MCKEGTLLGEIEEFALNLITKVTKAIGEGLGEGFGKSFWAGAEDLAKVLYGVGQE